MYLKPELVMTYGITYLSQIMEIDGYLSTSPTFDQAPVRTCEHCTKQLSVCLVRGRHDPQEGHNVMHIGVAPKGLARRQHVIDVPVLQLFFQDSRLQRASRHAIQAHMSAGFTKFVMQHKCTCQVGLSKTWMETLITTFQNMHCILHDRVFIGQAYV